MQNDTISGFQLSPQQKRLWLLQQNSSAYVTQCTIIIEGILQPDILKTAIQKIIKRHEIIRTSFCRLPGVKFPVMVVEDSSSFRLQDIDLSHLVEQEQLSQTERLFQESKHLNFDLEQGRIPNISLLKLSANKYILLIYLPAICADTQAIQNIFNEIINCYSAILTGEELDDEVVQYVQFSEWQNQLLTDEDAETANRYWQEQISTLATLRLPFEKKCFKQSGLEAECVQLAITPDLSAKIAIAAQNYDTSLAVVLLACWQILIWRLTGQTEITIGTACERREYEELQGIVGLLATWIPLKIHLTPNLSFQEVLELVVKTLDNTAEWQDYFVVEPVEKDNNLAFAIGFEFKQFVEKRFVADVSFSLEKVKSCIEPFKVKLVCTQKDKSLTTEFYYDVNYFSTDTIQRLASQFHTLLSSVFENPDAAIGQLQILSKSDYQQLLVFNQTDVDYPEAKCIHLLFEEQAAKTPNQIAVVCENQQLTYAELNRKANQLAHYLQQQGVQPEVVVGLCVERSLEMIIGLLGILKAGGAYLALDPMLPTQGLSFRLQDAQVPLLLTQQKLLDALPTNVTQVVCLDTDWEIIVQRDDNPSSQVTSENLVYVLFTSGSTGQPKKVAVEHCQLFNYINAILEKLDLPTGASFATVSSFAADLGNTVIFPSFCIGGCLHIISQQRATNPEALTNYCELHPIDCLKIVPTHLNALLTAVHPQKILPRKYLILGGEVLSWNLVEKIQQYAPNCQILNHYGPTETTIGVLTYLVEEKPIRYESDTVPLGSPLANTQVYILDNDLQPLPLGVPGELHIGGKGLARGYINQPELTNDKFVRNPFEKAQGSRLYKTGDLGRYLLNGNIEFLGRIDDQIKIRGFRIEPGEIESVLREHSLIRECTLLAREDESGNQRLVAYIVPSQHEFVLSDLRNFLKQKLPEYMIPSAFVQLEFLPLTPNGKVDRRALPEPDSIRPELQQTFVAPRTPVEETIAKIWAQVLELERVGINDNFFELGGDSIMIIQIAARVNQAGLQVTPKEIFEYPTVASLATVIDASSNIKFKNQPESGLLPLTPMQGLETENIEDIYELTPIQKGIIFHSLYAPEFGLYFFQTRFTLRGALNLVAFKRAWQTVVERHTILRTGFYWQDVDRPLQVVYKQVKVPLELYNWCDINPDEQQRSLNSFLKSDREKGFDLSQECLMRLTLFQCGEDLHELVWSRHFIIADGWSIPLVLGEVVQIYEALCQGEEIALAPSVPFRKYIEWLEQQDVTKAQMFWQDELKGVKAPTSLNNLLADNLSNQEEKYDDQQIILSEATTNALHLFARQQQLTLNTIIQGAWAILLSRYTNQEEVVYGCTVSGRPVNLVGAESIVGMLVNTLPVRVKVNAEQSLLSWLKQFQAQMFEMREYEYSSLLDIQGWTEVQRGVPLFESIVVFENLPVPQNLREENRSITVLDSNNFYKINYPLTIVVIPDHPLVLGINYDFKRVDIGTIRGILTHFQILLQEIIANPELRLKDLCLRTKQEQYIASMLEKQVTFDFSM
jgi:amino acid adenylation domain-containing protein